MKFANLDGRMHLVRDGQVLDIGEASGGRLPSDPGDVYAQWPDVTAWAAEQTAGSFTHVPDDSEFRAPSPAPRQVFALGTNYRKHAEETGWPVPTTPMVFTKFPSSVAGPGAHVAVTGPRVDWEIELVVVVGTGGHRIPRTDAWGAIAGFTVGQDISDRDVQLQPESYPQFGLGKSFPGFAPTGPVLADLDEVQDPHDLALRCWVNDELMQDGRTDDLVFDIPAIVEHLSGVVTLFPGDLIFTGTPSGVGTGMSPPRYLNPGDKVRSSIDRIGDLTISFVDRQPMPHGP